MSTSISTPLLAPMFALAAWTFCVLVLVAARRLTARVHPREFALGESAKVPPPALLANRNYMNLLELPLLFYVACLTAAVAGLGSPALRAAAWAYVVLRVVHSVVHLTYNHVMHRFAAFAASNLALIVLWVLLGLALFGARPTA